MSIGPRAEHVDREKQHYVPALGYSWLNRLYDPVVALTCREKTFRKRLLDLSQVRDGEQLLDLACGTGTFAVTLKAHHPRAVVRGLDADPGILGFARDKARRMGAEVQFDEGVSFDMPYADETFHVVFTSLFFHHLRTEEKLRTMGEVVRVLKPGGAFFVCDWGPAVGVYAKLAFNLVRMLDGFAVTRDNLEGRLADFLRRAGFAEVEDSGRLNTMLGSLQFLTGKKQAAAMPEEGWAIH